MNLFTSSTTNLSAVDFDALHAAVAPQPDSEPWTEIPWELSLSEARLSAEREHKPLLMCAYWSPAESRCASITVTVEDSAAGLLRLEGFAALKDAGVGRDNRSYNARIQGVIAVELQQQRITRFDLHSRGEARGEGRWTAGAPQDEFPLVIAFSLAGNAPADQIPPDACRNPDLYFGNKLSVRRTVKG